MRASPTAGPIDRALHLVDSLSLNSNSVCLPAATPLDSKEFSHNLPIAAGWDLEEANWVKEKQFLISKSIFVAYFAAGLVALCTIIALSFLVAKKSGDPSVQITTQAPSLVPIESPTENVLSMLPGQFTNAALEREDSLGNRAHERLLDDRK